MIHIFENSPICAQNRKFYQENPHQLANKSFLMPVFLPKPKMQNSAF